MVVRILKNELFKLDYQCFSVDISTCEVDFLEPVLPTTLREIVWPHCSCGNPLIVTISEL